MATCAAISATSEAVLGLLRSAAAGSEFAGAAFAHYSHQQFEDPMADGISLHLYRVTIGSGRNQQPRLGLDGLRYRPSLPVDLHYLLTAWAATPMRQQRMLGWALRVIEDTSVLPSGVLNHHGPEGDVFAAAESVEVVWENLAVENWFSIWHGLRSKQPSATYVARMVMLDSDIAIGEYPDVQTRELVMADGTP